jgi:hypothetical protein
MGNEIVKKSESLPDAIDGYNDAIEGGTEGQDPAEWIKFTDVFMLGENSIDGEKRVVINITRCVVKRNEDWQELDRRTLQEDQKFPDVDRMNEDAPRQEWFTDLNGRERGPWMAQREVTLLDMRGDMSRQVYSTTTGGGQRAVSDLAYRIKNMRRFRGARVFPEVELSHVFMPTKFGGRERPYFRIIRWLMPGTDGHLIEIPSDPTKPLPPVAGAPQAHITEVSEPSLAEEAQDQVPF